MSQQDIIEKLRQKNRAHVDRIRYLEERIKTAIETDAIIALNKTLEKKRVYILHLEDRICDQRDSNNKVVSDLWFLQMNHKKMKLRLTKAENKVERLEEALEEYEDRVLA